MTSDPTGMEPGIITKLSPLFGSPAAGTPVRLAGIGPLTDALTAA
jgi:hypothetical protein